MKRPHEDSHASTLPVEVPSFTYDPQWPRTPASMRYADVADVAVSQDDVVYAITRFDTRVIALNLDGEVVATWGDGAFVRTHGITAASDGSLWCVDQGEHTVSQWDPVGRLVRKLGTAGKPSDTGYDGRDTASVVRSAGPFNEPTKVAVDAESGDLFVSDGYGNSRVHHFSGDGAFLHSWGTPGSEDEQLRLPHYVAFNADHHLLVADRENDRIQVFTPDGKLVRQWPHQRPGAIATDRDGLVYVCALPRRPGQQSFRLGPVDEYCEPFVSIMDSYGNVFATIRPQEDDDWSFAAPHGMAFDSHGNLYVAEVAYSDAVGSNVPIPNATPLKRFLRAGGRAVGGSR